jgi:hypothetical protein
MLRYTNDAPALGFELFGVLAISLYSLPKLPVPERFVTFSTALTFFAPVPETPIHEDDHSLLREYHIRIARKCFAKACFEPNGRQITNSHTPQGGS